MTIMYLKFISKTLFLGLFFMQLNADARDRDFLQYEVGVNVSKPLFMCFDAYKNYIFEPSFKFKKDFYFGIGTLGYSKFIADENTTDDFTFTQKGFYYKIGGGVRIWRNWIFGGSLIGSHFNVKHTFEIYSPYYQTYSGSEEFKGQFKLGYEVFTEFFVFQYKHLYVSSIIRASNSIKNLKFTSKPHFLYTPGFGYFVWGGVSLTVGYMF